MEAGTRQMKRKARTFQETVALILLEKSWDDGEKWMETKELEWWWLTHQGVWKQFLPPRSSSHCTVVSRISVWPQPTSQPGLLLLCVNMLSLLLNCPQNRLADSNACCLWSHLGLHLEWCSPLLFTCQDLWFMKPLGLFWARTIAFSSEVIALSISITH